MKKIWKIRKNREAVSPVIATILMVAITVVLAAVLYVMVMGFGTSGQNTPTGSFSSTTSVTATSQKVQFGVITPDAKVADIKIIVTKNAATAAMSATLAATMTGTNANGTLTQLGGTANKVASGDYIILTGLGVGNTYTVSMIFIPTGNIIGVAMTFTK